MSFTLYIWFWKICEKNWTTDLKAILHIRLRLSKNWTRNWTDWTAHSQSIDAYRFYESNLNWTF
jgi:hypothetical protein